jgi:hypothetical protein
MATNLVSEIVKVLSPNIVSSIASALRLNPASLDKAIGGAVPALLAALISSLSKPKGAAKLANAMAKRQPDVLSSLASVIGGAGQNALIEQGTSALGALLGSKTSAALSDAVGKFSGLSGDGAKGLMGLIALWRSAHSGRSSASAASTARVLPSFSLRRRTMLSRRYRQTSPSISATQASSTR